MKVVTFAADNRRGVGLLDGDRVLDFTRAHALYATASGESPSPAADSVLGLLQAGAFSVETFAAVRGFIGEHRLIDALIVEDARILAPMPRPPRIIALGLNYAAHAAETGKATPTNPIFFAKASTAVIGPEEPVVCPRGAGRVDHEVELAVVIGRAGRRITRRKAWSHIAGYTILNDVTARDLQTRDMAASRPWFISKSYDTFAPMGPCIALPDDVPDPGQLSISLRVNGEVRQRSTTSDLVFGVPELIHRLSRHITLEPGDVIATGTPSGISPIEPGDVMEAEVEGIGVLRNPVVGGR
jgi:2-keto-4-pentenoate hydratase/2-oxohepta-3-ene-1,7-dioic acid hydratase in catechol pathway